MAITVPYAGSADTAAALLAIGGSTGAVEYEGFAGDAFPNAKSGAPAAAYSAANFLSFAAASAGNFALVTPGLANASREATTLFAEAGDQTAGLWILGGPLATTTSGAIVIFWDANVEPAIASRFGFAPAVPATAPTVRGATVATASAGADPSLLVPPQAVNGDTLLLMVTALDAGALTPPAGFTQIAADTFNGVQQAIFVGTYTAPTPAIYIGAEPVEDYVIGPTSLTGLYVGD